MTGLTKTGSNIPDYVMLEAALSSFSDAQLQAELNRREQIEVDGLMANTEKALDYRLWELYVNDCNQTKTRPTIKDYTIWIQDEDYV